MDDKEYYSLMNRPSSYALQQALKKMQKEKQKTGARQTVKTAELPENYRELELRQGSADAQMLMEKDQEE